MTKRILYPSIQGPKGLGLAAHLPARTADASSQGNSSRTRPARASLETPFSRSFSGAACSAGSIPSLHEATDVGLSRNHWDGGPEHALMLLCMVVPASASPAKPGVDTGKGLSASCIGDVQHRGTGMAHSYAAMRTQATLPVMPPHCLSCQLWCVCGLVCVSQVQLCIFADHE